MNGLAEVVDVFYERLGARNWIFPDALNLDSVESLLRDNPDPSAAEKALVDLYMDPETHKYWVMRLTRAEGFSARRHQIRRALKHYESDEFDSCVLHLIAVMDGFVNDFDPELRKGLAARDPEAMTAWDSVVGHHLGLTHALKAFGKTIRKRVDEETLELYRHGIMHGAITHFDNPVVATKAWNMLFAVADWATATIRSRAPQPEEPSLSDTFEQLRRNKRVRDQLDAWRSATHLSGQEGFAELEITRRTNDFLGAWHKQNFGLMASFESRSFTAHTRERQVAGELRDRLEGYELQRLRGSAGGEFGACSLDRAWSGDGERRPGLFRVPVDFAELRRTVRIRGRNGRVAPSLRADYLGSIGMITEARLVDSGASDESRSLGLWSSPGHHPT